MNGIRVIVLTYLMLALPVSAFSQCSCAAGCSGNDLACSVASKGCCDLGASTSGQCCSGEDGSTSCSSTCDCSCRSTTNAILSKDLIDTFSSDVGSIHLDVVKVATSARDRILNVTVRPLISHNERQATLSVWQK